MGEPISKERADLIKSLQAENKKLRDKEPDDDLTIAYLYGYNKGKDFSLAENKRLQDESRMLQRAITMIRITTKDPKVDKIAYDAEVEIKEMNDGGTSQ